ncbi:MAG: DUF1013 domain-containing protein [Rhodospirillales bacterium]|nr:DUF1013 domain-containing protein [Rhodospirillales bacterium]MCW8861956.1 DUF1013 domain-containing protein [Rhodospirillales bacterium]MCW8952708.1 DUF1013 domain-containing protein [Rhodospirillales bacterium]MCW8969614.1 DUF1013 domain-containing protein [Rhodospirillales bacterium]MCW9002988.1 DUF1013 domain-containing protein [Rhodospirillales bacterium]
MAQLLMPKATAVWLVENTALTFEQIAAFCGLHPLEVQAIADGDVATGMQGLDPVVNGQLSQEEIDRCSTDQTARLKMSVARVPETDTRPKGARYTPVSKRQDRPDGIAWLIKNYPELSDPQISKLLGTTKPTINAIRDRTHWNASNIKPRNPVHLGLCGAEALEKAIALARAKTKTVSAPAAVEGSEEPAAAPEAPQESSLETAQELTPEMVFGPPKEKSESE